MRLIGMRLAPAARSFADEGDVTDIERSDGLEAGMNLNFQKAWWRFEVVAYSVITLLVLGALAGAFGRGPLSQASAGDPGAPLRVDYERLARFRTPTAMIVHLRAPVTNDSVVALQVTGSLVDRLPISRIEPQPTKQTPVPGGVRYTWTLASRGDSTSVRFVLEPGSVGRGEGTVQAAGAAPLRLSQFVYP